MDTRTESRTQAHENIRDEQLQQKCVFDNKVKRNRTEIKQGDHILVRNIRKEKKLPGSKEENKYIGPMIVTDILLEILDWTKELFPEWGKNRISNYVNNILYGVALEHIQHELLESRMQYSTNIHSLTSDDPLITPITVEWQKEKCALLGCPFEDATDQHSTIVGQKLQQYEPWLCDSIVPDGNCLFRCLSKIICGTEKYHNKIRGEVCRYMLYDGKDTLSWYFSQVLSTTPAMHISNSCMYQNGIWGTMLS